MAQAFKMSMFTRICAGLHPTAFTVSPTRMFSSSRNSAVALRFLNDQKEDEQARIYKLNDLRDMKGARQNPKRVGRGRGSGLGKTCGRGHKGAGQRQSNKNPYRGFEGGQTPLWKRTPKRGRRLAHLKTKHLGLNLFKLLQFIQDGRIDTSKTIDMKAMNDSGLLGKSFYQAVQ